MRVDTLHRASGCREKVRPDSFLICVICLTAGFGSTGRRKQENEADVMLRKRTEIMPRYLHIPNCHFDVELKYTKIV